MGNFTRGRRSRTGGAAFASHDALHPASAEEHQLARDLISAPAASFPSDPTEFFQRHIHPSGRPWSFEGHEFLRALIADPAEHRVIQKAAQMGISTFAMGQLAQWCTMGYKVGYYLADRDFMTAFVQDKLDPLLNADELLAQATTEGKSFDQDAATSRARRKSADNLRVKHIAAGSAWFMGLQKRKDVKSIDLDAYILDEVDEVNQDLAGWLDDRLFHSRFRRIIELSQPSVPEWGINERYNATDQKSYLHRCPFCRTWHCLEDEWPDCMVARIARQSVPIEEVSDKREDLHLLDWRIICLKCGTRLRTPEARTPHTVKAEWVARHPGRPVSGYRLSQIYGPAMTPAYLAQKWIGARTKGLKKANYIISVLGNAHPGDRQPVSEQVFSAACQSWPVSLAAYLSRYAESHPGEQQRPLLLAGVDQGDNIHGLIGGWDGEHLDVVDIFILHDDWEMLASILQAVDMFVIDALPNKSNAKKLLRAPGLNGAMSYLSAKQWTVTQEEGESQIPLRVVNDDRTTAIDEMADEIIAGVMRFPAAKHDSVQTCKRQLAQLVKDFDPATGRFVYKRGVDNHFGMAGASLVQARKLAIELGLGPRAPLGDPSTWTIRKSLSPHRHRD